MFKNLLKSIVDFAIAGIFMQIFFACVNNLFSGVIFGDAGFYQGLKPLYADK